ncbi:MAG: PQQ-dependent sugar dehydrogenase [Myxococcota bacterium]
MPRRVVLALVTLSVLGFAGVIACQSLRAAAVKVYPQDYAPEGDPGKWEAVFLGKDEARPRIPVSLVKVAQGFVQPTAAESVPGEPGVFVLLEKGGALKWATTSGASGQLAKLDVTTASEQGLLGVAFHPRFQENRRFFLHYTTEKDGRDVSRVEEWKADGAPLSKSKVSATRVVLEVEQPYANHNGGHLLFGPDGFLYVGYGDGGYRADPHGHGQRMDSLLGKMLRLDIDAADPGKGYAVPKDNPFLGTPAARPEIWALGLRNPWRYSFDPLGRLVVADVGQDAWEEVSLVGRGDNLGWNIREAAHCFQPAQGCRTEGLVEPIYEYGRDEGQSVTGGVVATGERAPALKGKYVFGDFITGRLWALTLPDNSGEKAQVSALGKWPILPSSFARDEAGDVYVLDYGGGALLRLEPISP